VLSAVGFDHGDEDVDLLHDSLAAVHLDAVADAVGLFQDDVDAGGPRGQELAERDRRDDDEPERVGSQEDEQRGGGHAHLGERDQPHDVVDRPLHTAGERAALRELHPAEPLADEDLRLVAEHEADDDDDHRDEQLRDEAGDARPERAGVADLGHVERDEDGDTEDEQRREPAHDRDCRGAEVLGGALEGGALDGTVDSGLTEQPPVEDADEKSDRAPENQDRRRDPEAVGDRRDRDPPPGHLSSPPGRVPGGAAPP